MGSHRNVTFTLAAAGRAGVCVRERAGVCVRERARGNESVCVRD